MTTTSTTRTSAQDRAREEAEARARAEAQAREARAKAAQEAKAKAAQEAKAKAAQEAKTQADAQEAVDGHLEQATDPLATKSVAPVAKSASTTSSVATKSATVDPVPATGGQGPVAHPDDETLDLSSGQTSITVDVLANDDLTDAEVTAVTAEVVDGVGYATVSTTDDGKLQVTANPGVVPPGGADVEISYTVEDATGATTTSTLSVHISPLAPTAASQTTDDFEEGEYDPATEKRVQTQADFNTTEDTYILYREDDESSWVQVASKVGGEETQSSFLVDNGIDPANGQFIMLTDAGGGTGGDHGLAGTTNAPPPGAITPTVQAQNGLITDVTFKIGNSDAYTAKLSLTADRPVIDIPANTDPADPYVPIRDYTFTHTYSIQHTSPGSNFSPGARRDVPEQFTTTITAEELRTMGPMTESELVAEARTRTEEEARARETPYSATQTSRKFNGYVPREDEMSVSNPYDGADVQLVGQVIPQGDDAPEAVAFFIQGDNEIRSGANGDTLGRISFEVYPSTTGEPHTVDNEEDGDIQLMSAFAYNPADGSVTDLGDKFFIRPTPGLEGEFEIGLEADQSVIASEFMGQTIVLQVQGTREGGGTYDTTVFFNPTSGAVAGQNEDSLQLVSTFNAGGENIPVVASGAAQDALMPSVNSQLLAPHINTRAQRIHDGLTSQFYIPSAASIAEDLTASASLTGPPTVILQTQGSGVTHLGLPDSFNPANPPTIASFDSVELSATYSSRFRANNYEDTVVDTVAVTGAELDTSAMSAEDVARFNANFRIDSTADGHKIVQTGWVDPSEPLNIQMSLTLEGGGQVTVPYDINGRDIQFPGRAIAEALSNPELVEGGPSSAGLLTPALTDASGVPNVQIAGKTLTQEDLQTLTTELTGLVPDLLADDEALLGLGLEQAEIDMLRDSQTLHNMAAAAPGLVSLEGTEVKPVMELLEDFGVREGFDDLMTVRREKVITDIFGEGANSEQVATELLAATTGFSYDGTSLTPLAEESPLAQNLARLDGPVRGEVTQTLVSLAALVDADATHAYLGAVQSDPSVAAAAFEQTMDELVDAADAQVELMSTKFMGYWEDGELTEAEIDAIMADPELSEEFLQGVMGMVQASGVDGFDLTSGLAGFANSVAGQFTGYRFNTTGGNQTIQESVTRGLLGALSEVGTIGELFSAPSLSANTDAALALASVGEEVFDLYAWNDTIKSEYNNNRGDARIVGVNSLFAFGRIAALSNEAAQSDFGTPQERWSMGLEIISAFGTTKGVLGKFADFGSTGQAAEIAAIGNQHYMTKESGGAVSLVAAQLDGPVTLDPDANAAAVAEYDNKVALFNSLEQVDVVEADGSTTKVWRGTDADGVEHTLDDVGRKALVDEVTNQVIVVENGEPVLYSKSLSVEEQFVPVALSESGAFDEGINAAAVAEYERKAALLLDLEEIEIDQPDGSKTTMWRGTDPYGQQHMFDEAGRQALEDEVSRQTVVERNGDKVLYETRTTEVGWAKRGENNIELSGGVTANFELTDERSLAILSAEPGALAEFEIPDDTAKFSTAVTPELRTNALATAHTDAIVGAGVGGQITVGGETVTVTDAMATAAADVKAGTAGFEMSAANAQTILDATAPNQIVELNVSDPRSLGTTFFRTVIDDDLRTQAMATRFNAQIRSKAVGDTITVFGEEVLVTRELQNAAIQASQTPNGLTNDVSERILRGQPGQLVDLGVDELNPSVTTKTVKLPVSDELRNKALVSSYGDDILDAGVGQQITVLGKPVEVTDELHRGALASKHSPAILAANVGDDITLDGQTVRVTQSLLDAAGEVKDGTAGAYSFIGPRSPRAKLIRTYLGIDDISKGIGRIKSAFGPRVTNSTLDGVSNLTRLTDIGVGSAQVLQGVARTAGGLAEFVGLGLDIYTTIDAFKNGSAVEQGISTTNLVLSTIGTAAGIAGILGPAAVGSAAFAAAGPIGIAVFAATMILALITPALTKAFTPEPTYEDIYGATTGFLTGDNAFGESVLNGPQVIQIPQDASKPKVEFVNGELRLQAGWDAGDLAEALGQSHEDDNADFLTRLLHLFHQYDEAAAA